MQLKINNKLFYGIDNHNGEVTIRLYDAFDKGRFNKWKDRVGDLINPNFKSDYAEDIFFVTSTTYGTLLGCFPLIDDNVDIVRIVYDFKEIVNIK